MSESYSVRLQKECHVFSAAHFITYSGNTCEPLHGHNYRVWAEVEGPLDENQYVIDFIVLRDTLQSITQALDHHMLLPTSHPHIHVNASAREVEVTFADRRWVFPRGECALLPVANTTAELLARHIGQQLRAALQDRLGVRPRVVRVGVDESQDQWGICTLCDEDE
jgi:6-pyruvoyltetrahydropterin/6-carboxytetrahydropterin synthase